MTKTSKCDIPVPYMSVANEEVDTTCVSYLRYIYAAENVHYWIKDLNNKRSNIPSKTYLKPICLEGEVRQHRFLFQ